MQVPRCLRAFESLTKRPWASVRPALIAWRIRPSCHGLVRGGRLRESGLRCLGWVCGAGARRSKGVDGIIGLVVLRSYVFLHWKL